MNYISIIFITVLIFPSVAKSQSRNYWQELETSVQSKQYSAIEAASKNVVVNEGLELRVLLSILHSNGVPISGAQRTSLIGICRNSKRSFFSNRRHLSQIDSLFSEAYIVHRNERISTEKKLKHYEEAPLTIFNDRVRNKYQTDSRNYSYYEYLKNWLRQPGKSEDEAIIEFLRGKGVAVNSLLSYEQLASIFPSAYEYPIQFDTSAQKLLTYYRIKSRENENGGQIGAALNYVDSIAVRFPNLYADDFGHARRLAIKHRMDSQYLRLLTMERENRVAVSNYSDTMTTYGRTKDDVAFVKAVLRSNAAKVELASGKGLPLINYDLCLLSNRFAELQNFGSNISYPKNAIGYVIEDKGRKQNLYLEYVEESLKVFPYAIQVLFLTPDDWNGDINSNFNYIRLHLHQYNANGQRSNDSVFALFRKVTERLVVLGFTDLEDYYSTDDYFTTAIKHKPSNYGWWMGKGNFSEKIVVNDTTIENRKKNFLLPFSLLKI